MGFQAVAKGNSDTSENDFVTLTKGMDIKALTNTHDCLRQTVMNRSQITSEVPQNKLGQCEVRTHGNFQIIPAPLYQSRYLTGKLHGRGLVCYRMPLFKAHLKSRPERTVAKHLRRQGAPQPAPVNGMSHPGRLLLSRQLERIRHRCGQQPTNRMLRER